MSRHANESSQNKRSALRRTPGGGSIIDADGQAEKILYYENPTRYAQFFMQAKKANRAHYAP